MFLLFSNTKKSIVFLSIVTLSTIFLLISTSRSFGQGHHERGYLNVVKSRGIVGPDLSEGKFKYGSKDSDLFRSIIGGRAGGMPSFKKVLKEGEIWSVISYVRSLSEDIQRFKKEEMIKAGKTHYLENCSACHGKDAKGGVAPNLADKKWRYGSREGAIFKSISEGRPGGMHGWKKYLGDENIWQIIAYLRSISSDMEEEHRLEILAQKGKVVFLERCAACHGKEGGGKIGPRLTGGAWRYGSSDAKLFESISKGRHGGKMPSFMKTLGKDKIWYVIAYVRSLAEIEEAKKIEKLIAKGKMTYIKRCSLCHGKDVRSFPVAPPPFSEGIFPCSNCHEDMEVNTERRELTEEHENIKLNHAEGQRWCLDCHDAKNRDMLHLVSGEKIPFTKSYRLCGQCHGDKYRDWRAGVHGKRVGMWDGQKKYFLCASCHNPHSPHFKPIVPLPPPKRPTEIK